MADTEPSFVTSTFRYVSLPTIDGAKPYFYTYADKVTGERKRNTTSEDHDYSIENMRGKEDTVGLDKTGFQFMQAETKHHAFDNEDAIRNEYYPECSELVKKATGANRVVVFDHSTSAAIAFLFLLLTV